MKHNYQGNYNDDPTMCEKQAGIIEIECTSLDCPILFKRHSTKIQLLSQRQSIKAIVELGQKRN